MTRAPYVLCFAALIFSAAIPAQDNKNAPPPLGTAAFTPAESTKQQPLTNETFVVRAAVTNMAEIELGELVLKSSSEPSLRRYATQLIQEHKASQAKLTAIAATAKVALPGAVDDEHRKQKEELAELTGADFDRRFVALMRSGHDQAIALFKSAGTTQQLAAPFKSYAAENLKSVQTHRDDLEKLRTSAIR